MIRIVTISIALLWSWTLPAQEKINALVVKNNRTITIQNGKKKVLVDFKMVVFNPDGDRYTLVEIPYSLANPVKDLSGQVKDMKGKVLRKLRKSDIEKRSYISSISLYDDWQVMTFRLTEKEYPYTLEYSYEQNYNEFLSVAHWIPDAFNIPNNGSRLEVRLPKGYEVNIDLQNIDEPEITEEGETDIYVWEHENASPVRRQTLAPTRSELVSRVRISPVQFKYGVKGSLENWASFGAWQDRLNEGLDELPPGELARIETLLMGVTDDIEKVKILYHYMQDKTRYINVSIDIGGLKPYPASYVSENGYGDCKALTNYMKSLLEAAGIKAFYVKLYAGENYVPVREEYVGHQSNHVILCVPMAEDTVWLENTDKLNPFNYVSTFIQNRKGLLVDGDKSRLIQIPQLTVDEVREELSFNYRLHNSGDIEIGGNRLVLGDKFELYKSMAGFWSEADKIEYVQNRLPHSNYQLVDWNINKGDRDDLEIGLEYNLIQKNAIERYNDFSVYTVDPLQLPRFEQPDSRTQNVRINYPVNQIANYTFELESFSHSKIEASHAETISSRFGNYKVSSSVDASGNLVLTKQFLLYQGEVDLGEYDEFYDFMNRVYLVEDRLKVMIEK